jgi:hypothetical protein
LPNNILFPELDELQLRISDKWPLGSLRFLTNLINLSHLVKFSCEVNVRIIGSEFLSNFGTLLKLASNIRSLAILLPPGFIWVNGYNMEIYSVVPHSVRHLTFSVSSVHQMHMTLRQLKYRPSIRFEISKTNDHTADDILLAWFEHENGYYSYRLNNSSLCMWFDKYDKTS